MAQYRLLVKQGVAGVAAPLHNGSSERIGNFLRVDGAIRQVRVLIAHFLTDEGSGRIWVPAMHGYSPFVTVVMLCGQGRVSDGIDPRPTRDL